MFCNKINTSNRHDVDGYASCSIRDKFNIRNVIYIYSAGIILFGLVNYYIKIFLNNQILNYSIKDLLLISFGRVVYQISILIFPVLFAAILYGMYINKKNDRSIRYLFTKNFRLRFILSLAFTLFVVYLNCRYGVNKDASTILYIAFFSFVINVLILSAFVRLLRDVSLVLHIRKN